MASSGTGEPWLGNLAQRLRDFARERDWEQFHAPKNLSMALAVEVSELLEEFQWLSEKESANPDPQRRTRIEAEMADVLIYLVRLADRLDVDLPAAVERKIELNHERYPAGQVRGRSDKYDQYE